MSNIKTRFISNTIFFFLVYAIMFYVVVRAVSMVMTHDEAYSFYNVKHFWWVETLCTGNTHWFNFLAMKTCVLFGLEKTSQLRWFTLLSSGVFLTTVYFWIKSIKDIPTKIVAFAIALLNPFLIDYLLLARGYSTALMFEVLSITCYYLALKNNKRNLSTLSLFFAGAAAIANFNFFYFFAAFSLLYFYRYYFKQGFGFLRNKLFYIESFFALGVAALVIKALQFITTCSNDIGAYGGEDLVRGVFVGYVHSFIYKDDVLNYSTFIIIAYVLLVLVILAAAYGIRFCKKHKNDWYTFASSVLLIMLGLTVFNKWCFDVLYPTYRTAFMFYPVIAMVLVGFINAVLTRQKVKAIVTYSISTLLIVHFLTTISFHKSFDYWQQADTKTCFTYLDSIGAKKVGIAPELFGVYRNYYQVTDKYKFKFDGKSINTAFPNGLDASQKELQQYQYLVLFPPYNLSFYKNNRVRFETIKYYSATGTLILIIKKI
ncbi:MAG: hypothetical protein KAZ71_02945 [Bacteroidia bacterium]|nr:hypothetical protein [Bacteroidia bacterium]